MTFRITDTGVSPISKPGMPGGNYLASGIEHNERGAPTAGGQMHAKMNEKRIRKLDPSRAGATCSSWKATPTPRSACSPGARSPVWVEALRLARKEGIHAKLMIPKLIYPVAETVYDDFFRSVQKGLVVEQSHLGQFYRLIRMFVNVPAGVEVFARSGSNPFTPGEVLERMRQLMLAMQRQKEVDFEPAG